MECPICFENKGVFVKKWENGYESLRCGNCGLIYCNPMKAFIQGYNEAYEDGGKYSGHLKIISNTIKEKGESALGWPYKTFLKYIRRNNIRFNTFFEVGCGIGHFIYYMNKLGFKAQGCDISVSAQKAAKELFGINILLSDFNERTVERESQEIIIAFELIEHLERPMNFFRIVESKLRKNGLFFLSTPNSDTGYPLTWNIPGAIPPFHLCIFNKQSLTQAAKLSGLEIIDFIQNRFCISLNLGNIIFQNPDYCTTQ